MCLTFNLSNGLWQITNSKLHYEENATSKSFTAYLPRIKHVTGVACTRRIADQFADQRILAAQPTAANSIRPQEHQNGKWWPKPVEKFELHKLSLLLPMWGGTSCTSWTQDMPSERNACSACPQHKGLHPLALPRRWVLRTWRPRCHLQQVLKRSRLWLVQRVSTLTNLRRFPKIAGWQKNNDVKILTPPSQLLVLLGLAIKWGGSQALLKELLIEFMVTLLEISDIFINQNAISKKWQPFPTGKSLDGERLPFS